MIMSTLPDLRGIMYEVKGVVFNSVILAVAGSDSLEMAFKAIERQAENLDADAIIDIKVTVLEGERGRGIAIVTGTAVRITK